MPTFSLDSGLVFERDTKFGGKGVTQTLEPRLFYVNTPYRDQSQFPTFDTDAATFNFSQIFSENRFVGSDRIGDANQVTAALVSRFLESDGAERCAWRSASASISATSACSSIRRRRWTSRARTSCWPRPAASPTLGPPTARCSTIPAIAAW